MLPRSARMRSAPEFRATTRRGVRAGRPTLVVHARLPHTSPPESSSTRVGFVVSKAVGNAVTRNRVKRRLRHLVRPLLQGCPQPVHLVVRALPAAATEPDRLADDLQGAVGTCLERLGLAR